MRNLILLLYCFSTIFLHNIYAQSYEDEIDPFLGNYILGNSAELIMLWTHSTGDTCNQQILDYNGSTQSLTAQAQQTYADSSGIYGTKKMDVATGDLNGDHYDDVVAVWEGNNHSILMSIPDIDATSLHLSTFNMIKIDSTFQSGLRIEAADFDQDRNKEILLAYRGLDSKIHISIYETDSMLNIIKLAEISDWDITESLFDITAGDFDGDGLDEIAVIQNTDIPYLGDHRYQTNFDVKVYDYNPDISLLISHEVKSISTVNDFNPPTSNDINAYITRLIISTGNFDGDLQEELAFGYELDFSYYESVYHTTFHNKINVIEISPSLDDVSNNPDNVGFTCNWWVSNYDQLLAGWHIGLECADLNNDGVDEIISLNSYNVSVLKVGQNFALSWVTDDRLTSQVHINCKYGFDSHRMLGVTDLDADTSASDLGKWQPEIVVFDFHNNPYQTNLPGVLRYWVYKPTVDESNVITGISAVSCIETAIDGAYLPSCVMALGDFDGDAVRLGTPRRFYKKTVIQPTVILNAPPVHFDVFNDTCYDVSLAYNENECLFKSFYLTQSGLEKEVQTEVHRDWGMSSSLTAGGSFLGIGASATLSAHYGEGFSKTDKNAQTITVSVAVDAIEDDRIYATVTDYSFWEYPLYFKGNRNGSIMAVIPHLQENRWFPSKSWSASQYVPNHEVGNILSYQKYASIENNPDLAQRISGSYSSDDSYVLDSYSSYDWNLSIEDFNESQADTSQDIGASISASVSGWGVEVNTEFHYDQSEISTHRTSVSEQLAMGVHLDGIDMGLGEVSYRVTPYSYWSKNGALVVDYSVEPELADPGYPPTWWDNRYGNLPDPAFILPWRYDPEKGFTLEDESKRFQTKEIIFRPSEPAPGDTVTIVARLHNYSLLATTDPINVCFYQGDPDDGGELITALSGETVVSTPALLEARDVVEVQIEWLVPEDISDFPRIFALIDPNDSINEIHENNNKGFNVLAVWKPLSIEPNTNLPLPTKLTLFQNYPNPFNSSTKIKFILPSSEKVTIEIFNVQGQKIQTILEDTMIKGEHQVDFNASSLASGLYFYRIKAGEYICVKKMIFLK